MISLQRNKETKNLINRYSFTALINPKLGKLKAEGMDSWFEKAINNHGHFLNSDIILFSSLMIRTRNCPLINGTDHYGKK
jgi:hypothetical protein